MPRRPRIHLADIPLHIVQRGHNRDACFFGEDDYHAYRHWLGEALKTSGCRLHAYVQMTNHVHLLLTPPAPEAVTQLVISLGRRYVQYINKTYRRTGTLWDSRYKSSLVQADPMLTPHAVYGALGRGEGARLAAYRALFRPELDAEAIGDIRMALDQGQPLGNSRFLNSIERATGQRREVKPRGRPRKPATKSLGAQEQLSMDIR